MVAVAGRGGLCVPTRGCVDGAAAAVASSIAPSGVAMNRPGVADGDGCEELSRWRSVLARTPAKASARVKSAQSANRSDGDLASATEKTWSSTLRLA
jgi:hypothetical protein